VNAPTALVHLSVIGGLHSYIHLLHPNNLLLMHCICFDALSPVNRKYLHRVILMLFVCCLLFAN